MSFTFYYTAIPLWALFFVLIGSNNPNTRAVIATNTGWRVGTKFGWAVMAFLPVFLVCTIAPARYDTVGYLDAFDALPSGFAAMMQSLFSTESGRTFWVIGNFSKMLFGNSRMAFRLILGLIHTLPVIAIFRRYSEDYFISIFLFVASAIYASFMMNGLRQFVAVVMIFSAFPWMLRKKHVYVVLMILFASTVHTSAIFFLPMYFIAQGKPFNWKTLLCIVAAVIGTIVFSGNIGAFEFVVANTEYAGAVQSLQQEYGDTGSNVIRTLVYAVPTVIAWINRDQLYAENNQLVSFCTNMAVITTCISLIANFTSGILVGRMPIYTALYTLILLPYQLNHYFESDSGIIIKFFMIVFYLLFYIVEMGLF